MIIRSIMTGKVIWIGTLLTALVCCGGRGYGTIQDAVAKGDLQDVKRHLIKGADVNTKDAWGDTPLHAAVYWGRMDVAKLLIARGADVDAKDADGWTPRHIAKKGGSKGAVERMVEMLVKHGAVE